MAPESVDREQLKDDLDEDAMSAYDERERQFGEELMRYLERSILLQVIDNRWREHLFDMDYLREGIHLRGFAQIDPLVAYKNEGFAIFEELMHSIWEEFSKLIFHVEVELDPAQAQEAFGATGGGGRSRWILRRHPGRPALRASGGGGGIGGCDGDERGGGGSRLRPQRGQRSDRDGGQGRARQNRPQRPVLVRVGEKVQEVPRGLDHREFIRAFNEGDLDAFVAVLDPEVRSTRCGGCERAARRHGCGRRGHPVGCSRGSSWISSMRTTSGSSP